MLLFVIVFLALFIFRAAKEQLEIVLRCPAGFPVASLRRGFVRQAARWAEQSVTFAEALRSLRDMSEERPHGPLQHLLSLEVREEDAVIGERDARLSRLEDAPQVLLAVDHACPAVHDEPDAREVLRVRPAEAEAEVQRAAHVLLQSPRDLHRAEIVALAAVVARLDDEDFVAGTKPVHGLHTLDEEVEIPVAHVVGHHDGEGRQRVLLRRPVRDDVEGLAVRDDELQTLG